MVRTRFAPSPTGYLHIGGARTALFSWAYARKMGGEFILRIEDTDLERSTQASVQAILDGMAWLGIDWDEGPYYQMQRMQRYKEVVDQLLEEGHAYYCYASKDELDVMREAQKARGDKPRYDGRWRPEAGKVLPNPPPGVTPVIRFKTPLDGVVTFNDMIKGPISVANVELDDLVIVRGDGVPTYNFGVVVDDWDMNISHVIRGDDHVNNTPRQINILKALGAPIPTYAHVPMILGHDGERLSKRHGAVSVLQYREEGFLPEALLNYLARLGWSHGDEEKFGLDQFVEWFDLGHVSHSAARFDGSKLAWLNQQYLKEADNARLAELVQPFLQAQNIDTTVGSSTPATLAGLIGLVKERVNTVEELADGLHIYYRQSLAAADELRAKLPKTALPAFEQLKLDFAGVSWEAPVLSQLLKDTAQAFGLKMGQIGMPLRLILFGTAQTPAIDQVLALLGREETLRRMQTAWPHTLAAVE